MHYISSTDVNECLYNPCQHNSPCSNTPGSYRCDCSPGWTGQNCDSGMCVHDHYVKWVKINSQLILQKLPSKSTFLVEKKKKKWALNVWNIVINNTYIIFNDYLVELYAVLLWQTHSDKIMCYVPFKYL